MKIFNYPVQNPKMRKALDTLLNSGYKLETVEVGKLVKDNELFNNNTLDYHTDVWGDHPAGYEFNPAEINNWSYSDMMSAVKNANGKIILENGRHRCRALYNSGYDYIELPVYDDSIKEDLKDDAKEYFGTTWNWKLGLYINTDGTILDGSGEKFGNVNPRYRTIDHREVSVLFDDIDGGDAMLAYMNEGNIRWKPEAPGFEVIKEPTEAQYKKLSELLWNFRDEFCIDISNTWGENICSEWYDNPREAIAALKEYFRTGRLLTEDTRNQLVAKSRGAGAYKDQTRGKNRFERKKYSKVANQVKSYNTIDMNKFFKQDTLEVTIPVTGETDNYDVVIRLDGVCSEIQRNIKSSRKLDYKTVMQAVTKVFNTANVYVKCSCQDFCLEADTKIKLLDGTTITVAELEKKVNESDKPVYLYSVDEKGDFKPGKINKVWVSGHTDHMLKVTLDNGNSIITTDEHPYMLRNGEYLPAHDLKVGQSLMPLYFGTTKNGYETVKANSIATTEFFSTYKQVAAALLTKEIELAKIRSGEDTIAIHHKDFNKKNNSPDNLLPMGFAEHYRYHYEHVFDSGAFEKFKQAGEDYRKLVMDHTTPEYKKQAAVMSNAINNYWGDMSDEEREHAVAVRSANSKAAWANGAFNTDARRAADAVRATTFRSPEMKKKAADGVRRYWANLSDEEREVALQQRIKNLSKGSGWNKGKHLSDEDKLHKSQAALNKTNEEKADCIRKIRETKILKVLNAMVQDKVDLTIDNYEKYRQIVNKFAPSIDKRFDSIDDAVEYFKLNHKITAIERIDYEMLQPVYDIEVDTYHNFYVDAGVILHNCYRFDHWSIINNYGVNDSAHDPGPGKGIANPNNDKGIGCKHILLTLANANWVMHVTSCIKNYIFYAEEHMQQAFQKVIFPKLYGIPYSAIEEENLAPDDIDLATEKHIIEVINDWAKNRGRFKKGSNKNSVTGTGGKAKPEQKPAEKPEEKKPVEQKTTDNKEKTEEPEEEVKK